MYSKSDNLTSNEHIVSSLVKNGLSFDYAFQMKSKQLNIK